MRGVFGPGTLVLGAAAAALLGFLAVGFLLPSTWEASAESRIRLPPSELQAYLDSPEGWLLWTPWPDSGLVRTGPPRGAGAQLAWDDSELGSGRFTVESADAGGGVTYTVDVQGEGGSPMRTRGAVVLQPDEDGTVLRWRESGDLGSNPLMGYWALFMERAQGAEMEKSLDRLADLVAQSGTPPPGDTARVATDSTSSPGPTR